MSKTIAAALALALIAPARAELAEAGRVTDEALREISGLAASRRAPGLFWAINDSGNPAVLHAIDASGRLRGSVPVTGAVNVDWEDLASFELDGQAWLAIADTGDNLHVRDDRVVYVVPEPAADAAATAPAQALRFTIPEGPVDVEALAVDAAGRRFLLAEKGRRPPPLFALPFEPAAGAAHVARRVAAIHGTAPDAVPLVMPLAGDYRGMVTALDLDRSGRRLLVLTLTHALVYARSPDETWDEALARAPVAKRTRLLQQEAAAFDARGDVWITTERLPAPLLRWRLP